mmetsp:Transcript_1698/g.2581  ORF Transcript_1698/g.2581 Transcript_1698/m.2581 type:complete len:314 (-) Transcript_1698:152-1093(-)|eukprot:CAMPEP_0194217226 /NCGR_PEP_ID=MMETSP0156-20130528/20678_1 /TAXON_ID=33649 /ORGANISM="Thalassionema nitzschioides, Strain L26-B" /LENGTH=313 /DNA_ID=CAMNT_0038946209 /DNA_START=123 /DNA_END=1064 /DNA_ORIENTATION=-
MDYAAKYQEYALRAAAAYKNSRPEDDTHECAEFLLTLKHRSVTPEHQLEESKTQTRIDDDSESIPHIKQFIVGNKCSKHGDDQIQMPPALLEEQGSLAVFWKTLLNGSRLVSISDRDLIPDPLLVAMAQMKPCSLTEADRVGCYKARPLGFTGMCCKHCDGQPGFGKYFPATVRSLSQTTTSQTIFKHIGSKCRFCPPHIREAVLELQRQQVIKEAANAGRPRYGSRKVFFQRVWTRLHGKGSTEEDSTPSSTPPTSSHNSEDEDARSLESTSTMSSSGDFSYKRAQLERKRRRYDLSTNLGGINSLSKRSRF